MLDDRIEREMKLRTCVADLESGALLLSLLAIGGEDKYSIVELVADANFEVSGHIEGRSSTGVNAEGGADGQDSGGPIH